MKFAIVMSTYRRKDGKTMEYIKRAIDSIFNQTYKDFKLFLIGDKFEDDFELIELITQYDSSKIFYKNIKFAKERDVYKEKLSIWSYGGVNAINIGLEYAIDEGFEYLCHLDHDDWWYDNHLQEINNCIELTGADWMCTKSTYNNQNDILPRITSDKKYIEFLPKPEGMIHSSSCFNIKKIPIRYMDIFMIEGVNKLPADAELWRRQKEYIVKNKLKSFLINTISCRHDHEGYEKE